MAEVTIYAEASGGRCDSSDATIANVWAGLGSLAAVPQADSRIGLETGYVNHEAFMEFDVAGNVPSGADIDSVALEFTRPDWGSHGSSGGTIEAYIYDWVAGGFTGSDYLTSSELSALYSDPGRMAYGTFPGNSSTVLTVALTSEDRFKDNLSDTTCIVIASAESRTAPGSPTIQDVYWYTGWYTSTPAYRPRLIVTYTEGGGGIAIPVVRHHLQMQHIA